MAQAITNRSRTKLRSAIGDEENMMCSNYAPDMRQMMTLLGVIEPLLKDVERYSLWDEAARDWLRRVWNAGHSISDIVDELQGARTRKMSVISIRPKKNTISNKMNEVKLELRKILQAHRIPSMPETTTIELQSPLSLSSPIPPPRPPLPEFMQRPARFDEGNIVGRGENKQRIIATLSTTDITEGPIILPIFGLATIGKTTLAKMVFEDTGFGDYKYRVWVKAAPEFDLFKLGKCIISKILEEISLQAENQIGNRPHCDGNQVSEEEINTDTDTDTDNTDGSSQESEEESNQVTDERINQARYRARQAAQEKINQTRYRALQKVEETSQGLDGASRVSQDETSEDSDETFQGSEDEINRGSEGTSQVLAEEISKGSYQTTNVLEEEINKGSEGASQVSQEKINKGSDGASQVSEDKINRGSDQISQLLSEEISKDSYQNTNVSEEEIKKGSDEACQVSQDEINKGSNRTSQLLLEEINKCSDGSSQVSGEEINKLGSDGTSRALAEDINKGTCETSEVLEDQEISHGINGISEVSEEEISEREKYTTQGAAGTCKVLESIKYGSHAISQISGEESKDGSGETSQVSDEEIIQCSNEISPVTEDKIHQGSDDVDYITKRLHESLNDMKALIVLDNLWEEDSDELERLKRMLGVGIKGSKVTVIVTTCNEGIARKVCTVKPYKLDPLIDDMCWTIIKQQSGFGSRTDSAKQELERIGPQIASKCGGLPLAAQELGHSLRHEDARSWAEVMKRDIWSNIRSNNSVIQSLVLSYRSMPPDLRLCFGYCVIFPNGHKFVKDDLIHQWIALGLLKPSATLSITEVADEYIRRLMDISFLQSAESATSTSGNGDTGAILFTMHQMVHALARSLGDELIVLDDRMCTSDQNKCYHYALLTNFGVKLLSSKLPTQLRALRCVGCSRMALRDDVFSLTRCLRVLHLNGCSMQMLPDSICRLRQLGYLNLSGCSRLVTLPESFGGLVNLLHINLSRCYGLAKLPESFRMLKKIVYLDLSFWCCFEGIRVLDGLTSLEHLNLSHPCGYLDQHRQHMEGLKDVLHKLTSLQYLNLSMCMNPIFTYLTEDECCEYIRSCTRGLSNLKHLDLSHNIFLVGLPESLGELHKLHTLDLTGCIRLKSLAKRICERDSLKVILIRNCRGLESCSFVVHTEDGGFSSNLVQLEDVNCQDLEITCLEKVKSMEEAYRIRLVKKKNVEKLTLCWTVGSQGSVENDDNLLSQLEPPHDLQHLELHGYRSTYLPAWASSISSHLPNLKEVTMEDFPRCRSLPPFAQLPNLQRLVLRRMASITRIDAGEFSGGNTAAPALNRLTNFTVDDMKSLEEFSTTYYCASGEQVMFPAIDELVVQKCSKLRFRFLPPIARRLVISDCTQLLSSSRLLVPGYDQAIASQKKTAAGSGGGVEGPCITPAQGAPAPIAELVIHGCIADWTLLRYLAGLQTLSISHCEGMTSLPQDMGHLNSLHDLQIMCCKQLKCFPDSMQYLTSLHSMHFAKCDSIKKFPKWFGRLTSLQKLSIHECNAFKSLPRSIKGLNNLKDLDIVESQRLIDWCKLEKNKKKLGHIQPKLIGDTAILSTWDFFFGS